jgi:hypothetical protein
MVLGVCAVAASCVVAIACAQAKMSPAPQAASVERGRVMVSGRPFFPVMLFELCDAASLELGRELGANVVVGGDCPDRLLPKGMYVVPPLDAGATSPNATVLGRAYPDEPDNHGQTAAQLRAEHPARRGSPDGRLTFLTTSAGFFSRAYSSPNPPLAEYRALARLADVTGFDLYPIAHCDRSVRAVYDAQREFVRLAGGAPTFQWIETGPLRGQDCGGFATVQPAELRAEVWLAVVGGARGIGYFTHTWTPDHHEFDVAEPLRDEMKRTDADLAALAPGLLGETRRASSDAAAVEVLARRAGGKLYVFAVNSGRSHVRAQLHVPDLLYGPLAVVGEKRRVGADVNHNFADTFPPLGVHVYVQKR